MNTDSVSADSCERRHEAKNPSVGRIALAAVLVPLMIGAGLVVSWWAMAVGSHARPMNPALRLQGTIVAPNFEPLARFPSPHLQLNPAKDLAAFRRQEDAELGGYGWIDRQAGTVRIPINRAIDLLAQRGLPARAGNRPPAVGKSEYELSKERNLEQ